MTGVETETISSAANEKVKRFLLLRENSRARRREGLFTVEGRRETERCLEAGYRAEEVFFCPEIYSPGESFRALVGDTPLRPVSEKAYGKMACRGGTEGLAAVVRAKDTSLASLDLGPEALVIVLEGVEKPGNLGAVFRTADAAGAGAVIVCDPLADLYNPNLIRASLGAAFTVPAAACTTAECIAFLREKGIRIITAQLQDSRPYYSANMRRATAIVMGNEAAGLSETWRENADERVIIPMLGRTDSLNVSVSAAVLAYEAVRQRLCPERRSAR